MKYIKLLFIAFFTIVLAACQDNGIENESIFDTSSPKRTEFDTWILNNFTLPYNIDFQYHYNDKLSDNEYNVVPARLDNSKAMAILLKHVWLDSYREAVGEDFVKANTFRVVQLIGSPEYSGQGSIVLGTAEGGIMVTLFRLNELDIHNIHIEQDDPFRSRGALPLDLNHWYFHTMHHEFCHILTQKKQYTTDFQAISAGKYHSTDWINVSDEESGQEGFVTGYASDQYNEDFAETYSTYITLSDEGWNALLKKAGDEGAAIILKKLDIIRTYMQDSWGIDIDKLRTVVNRRCNEVKTLDLTKLN
jgi:substrate import-associated zinc metallohydrolase lipoprotein